MQGAAKPLLKATIKVGACLALNYFAPGLGALCGAFLAYQPGGNEADGGGDGMGALIPEITGGIIADVWSKYKTEQEVAKGYQLERTIVLALKAGIEASPLEAKVKKQAGANLEELSNHPIRLHGFLYSNLESSDDIANQQKIVLAVTQPQAAFEQAWMQIGALIRRQSSQITPEMLESLKESVLGNLQEHISRYLLTDPLARQKFSYFCDLLMIQLQQKTTEDIAQLLENMGKFSLILEVTNKATLEIQATLQAQADSIEEVLSSLKRANATEDFLAKYQIAQTKHSTLERRRQLSLCVGREKEHEEVFDWLSSQSQHRFLVVKAQSGTGKSTFMNGLLNRPELAGYRVAYHFFKNDMGGLQTARSALLHLIHTLKLADDVNDSWLPASANVGLEDLSQCFFGALHDLAKTGRPILILLDALDEAELRYQESFTWTAQLPENVYVVASVRSAHNERPTPLPQGDYEEFLLQESIEPKDVWTWMIQVGDGSLTEVADDQARNLHHATDGHTLFLSYIFGDLVAQLAARQTIDWTDVGKDLGKGFEGYIQKQWDRLAEVNDAAHHRCLLHLLAAAHDELPDRSIQKLTHSKEVNPPWIVKRWVRHRYEGSMRLWRFEHPRIKAAFLLVPDFLTSVHSLQEELFESCCSDSLLPNEYRLAWGITHAVEAHQAGNSNALSWAVEQLTNIEYIQRKAEGGQIPQLIREYAMVKELRA